MVIQWIFISALLTAAATVRGNFTIENNSNSSIPSSNRTQASVLHRLIQEHDTLIRPDAEVKQLQVGINFFIESFHSVSETEMDYSITGYFRQFWKDKRLQHDRADMISIDGDVTDMFWTPDTYFLNAKKEELHRSPKQNSLFHIYPDGTIIYSIRLTLTLSCPMDFTMFPFDHPECSIKIMSYAYKVKDIILTWYGNSSRCVEIEPTVKLPQYSIVDSSCTQDIIQYIPGNFSYLEVTFVFHRRLGFYLLQAFAPSLALAFISWLTLWIDPTFSPARATIAITTLLTLITQATWVRSGIPKVAYVTAIDIWLVVCISLVFIILLEFTTVYYLSKIGGQKEEKLVGAKTQSTCTIADDLPTVSGDVSPIIELPHTDIDKSTTIPFTNQVSSNTSTATTGVERGTTVTSPQNHTVSNTSIENIHVKRERYHSIELAQTIDRHCRIYFMVILVGCSLAYWVYYYYCTSKNIII